MLLSFFIQFSFLCKYYIILSRKFHNSLLYISLYVCMYISTIYICSHWNRSVLLNFYASDIVKDHDLEDHFQCLTTFGMRAYGREIKENRPFAKVKENMVSYHDIIVIMFPNKFRNILFYSIYYYHYYYYYYILQTKFGNILFLVSSYCFRYVFVRVCSQKLYKRSIWNHFRICRCAEQT